MNLTDLRSSTRYLVTSVLSGRYEERGQLLSATHASKLLYKTNKQTNKTVIGNSAIDIAEFRKKKKKVVRKTYRLVASWRL